VQTREEQKWMGTGKRVVSLCPKSSCRFMLVDEPKPQVQLPGRTPHSLRPAIRPVPPPPPDCSTDQGLRTYQQLDTRPTGDHVGQPVPAAGLRTRG